MTVKLYRAVHSGAEFRKYDFHWRSHNTLPDGVASVVVDEADELPVEFFVRVKPCEHGNYAAHPVSDHFLREMVDGVEWFALAQCDGEPKEDNND